MNTLSVPFRPRIVPVALVLWLLLSITLAMQSWVGDKTIYSPGLEVQREAFHQAILDNQPPGGKTWAQWGALSIQKRIGVVYPAEAVRRVTGWRIGQVYKALDTVFLFLSLLALYGVLHRWIGGRYALIGVLYFAAVLPLSYFFQLFHPWDRLQLLLWIVLLELVRAHRFLLLLLVLWLSVLVKFDTLFFPAFYLAVHWGIGVRSRVLLEAAVLALVAWGTYHVLGMKLPDPDEGSRFAMAGIVAQLQLNFSKLLAMNLRYPPLIVHGLAFVLAALTWRAQSRFVRMCVLFAILMSVIHVALTNYEEVRAHMMVLVLLLPAALLTLRQFFESDQFDKPGRSAGLGGTERVVSSR